MMATLLLQCSPSTLFFTFPTLDLSFFFFTEKTSSGRNSRLLLEEKERRDGLYLSFYSWKASHRFSPTKSKLVDVENGGSLDKKW